MTQEFAIHKQKPGVCRFMQIAEPFKASYGI